MEKQTVKMSASEATNLVTNAIVAKHTSDDWCCITEFRNGSGFHERRHSYIDVLAVGLFEKTRGVRAFEVKVTRQDFKRDIEHFQEKQEFALAVSNEFYYVCPKGLVSKDEVPEVAGLMTVSAHGVITTEKVAPRRECSSWGLSFVQSICARKRKETGELLHHLNPFSKKLFVKYCGQELNAEEFHEFIKKEIEKEKDRVVEARSQRIADEKVEKIAREYDNVLRSLKVFLYSSPRILGRRTPDELTPDVVHEILTSIFGKLTSSEKLWGSVQELKRHLESLEKFMSEDTNGKM